MVVKLLVPRFLEYMMRNRLSNKKMNVTINGKPVTDFRKNSSEIFL